MINIKNFDKIFEGSPRIPRLNERGLRYWKNKGKNGKDVMIYTHDDMDGIFSAIVVRDRMQDLGYNIKGYGILNYQEGWKNTSLKSEMINVAVDFADMPGPERADLIDIYIDHHGEFTPEEKEKFKEKGIPAIKTKTPSAYEGISRIIGKPADEIVLYSIDMIDSAKYDWYSVDWRDILYFDWDKFEEIRNREGEVEILPFTSHRYKNREGESKKFRPRSLKLGWPIIAKLTFAGAFNQLLKRADHKTIIEVIDNVKDPSIYGIYNAMKRIFPGNNIWTRSNKKLNAKKGDRQDFVKTRKDTIEQMKVKTRGSAYGTDLPTKEKITTQQEYVDKTGLHSKFGYQLLGNLVFVPTGVWANALRARALILEDLDAGRVAPEDKPDFILLQYGNTLQACGFDRLEDAFEPPVLSGGFVINDLGKYMRRLLVSFQKYFGYYEPDTEIGQEELTVSGGHVGIGTISNIVGRVNKEKIQARYNYQNRFRKEDEQLVITPEAEKFIEKYEGYKYTDLFKNKMIADLSGIEWPISLVWSSSEDADMRKQMISYIMKNDPRVENEIQSQVSDTLEEYPSLDPAIVRDNIFKIIKKLLDERDDNRIKEHYQRLMKDHKVLKRGDFRELDKSKMARTEDGELKWPFKGKDGETVYEFKNVNGFESFETKNDNNK